MVETLHPFILAIHIFLAIIWVGGVLFVGWGVFPTVAQNLSFEQQRIFFQMLMKNTHWLFTSAGIGVIVTGIYLGTLLGPIRNSYVLWHTPYGHKWLAALIIAILTLLWGILVGYRQAMKVFQDKSIWEQAEANNKEALHIALIKVAALESVEIIGFISLIFLMIAF